MRKNKTNQNPLVNQDPKKIEKELGEFLNKKFGGNVKIITPSILPKPEPTSGKAGLKGKKQFINFNIKPEELISYLDQYVVKQTKAKSILSTKIFAFILPVIFDMPSSVV